jgi:hypothetical protein
MIDDSIKKLVRWFASIVVPLFVGIDQINNHFAIEMAIEGIVNRPLHGLNDEYCRSPHSVLGLTANFNSIPRCLSSFQAPQGCRGASPFALLFDSQFGDVTIRLHPFLFMLGESHSS